MKFKTLVITLLFAVSMWAQNATPAPADQPTSKATASCCKDGAACCKDGAACCGKDKMTKGDCCKEGAACCGKDKMAKADCCKDGAACCGKDKDKMAKADAKGCCGGKMCKRHKA